MVSATLGDRLWDVAAEVTDPEMPMLTLADLGVLRSVTRDGDRVVATITPTYAGCPALDAMATTWRRSWRSSATSRCACR